MSNAGKILGKGIGFPPRIGADGRVVWSEGEENIRESIRVILMTELNERLYLPEFGGGLNRFLFEPNTTTTRQLIRDRITKALARLGAAHRRSDGQRRAGRAGSAIGNRHDLLQTRGNASRPSA